MYMIISKQVLLLSSLLSLLSSLLWLILLLALAQAGATPLAASTPNLPTNIIPTNIAWLKLSGKSPMDMGIPPIKFKIMLESNPLKPTMLPRIIGRKTSDGILKVCVVLPQLCCKLSGIMFQRWDKVRDIVASFVFCYFTFSRNLVITRNTFREVKLAEFVSLGYRPWHYHDYNVKNTLLLCQPLLCSPATKLLPSPWFDAPRAYLPKGIILRSSVVFPRPRSPNFKVDAKIHHSSSQKWVFVSDRLHSHWPCPRTLI